MQPKNSDITFGERDVSIFQEVLLSLRLIFSDPVSSELLLKELANARNKGEEVDPLLGELANPLPEIVRELTNRLPGFLTSSFSLSEQNTVDPRLFPHFARNRTRKIKASDAFLAHVDFPVYGQRLQDLQRHIRRLTPSPGSRLLQWLLSFIVAALTLLVGALTLGRG